MLKSLHVRNYVLIDSLDVSFPEGLIIITGQTGAGKSILLGALSLLMGAKADAASISEGADNCVVEAEFDVCSVEARQIVEDNEAEWESGHLIIRRVVNVSGRSRSFINDSPVPVGVLASLSSYLIDIHSQHQSLNLADRRFQLSVLDHYAGNGDALEECSATWRKVLSLRHELAELNGKLSRILSEKDYNEAQYSQLDSAGLKEGELDDLEAVQKQLANSEEIKSCLFQLEESGIRTDLKDVSRLIDKLSRYIPSYSSLLERFESSKIELEDILDELSDANEKMEMSPERLMAVEDRMSLLYGLMKKHSCNSVEELIEIRDNLSDLLFDSSGLEARKEALESAFSEAERHLSEVSTRLHTTRMAAAPQLSELIEKILHFLELDNAVFRIDMESAETGPSGADAVSFRFSASGRNPVDVAKCASGGEISRIMLCLKKVMAHYTNMPTMFFDEIDTGVSGSVADKMGSMICEMGKDMQVFAITHLPQVAAKGRAHYLVSKTDGERVYSSIEKLDDEHRILELARMLSGSSITDAAVANAKSLLSESVNNLG